MASKVLMDKDENRGWTIARIEERRAYSVLRGLSDKRKQFGVGVSLRVSLQFRFSFVDSSVPVSLRVSLLCAIIILIKTIGYAVEFRCL